jgi:hypothetical protein
VALPLKDFRLGISDSIDAVLKAEAAAFDKDMQTVAREILQEWADRKHRAYSMYAKLVLANGMQTELPGFEMGDDGTSRISPLKARK